MIQMLSLGQMSELKPRPKAFPNDSTIELTQTIHGQCYPSQINLG